VRSQGRGRLSQRPADGKSEGQIIEIGFEAPIGAAGPVAAEFRESLELGARDRVDADESCMSRGDAADPDLPLIGVEDVLRRDDAIASGDGARDPAVPGLTTEQLIYVGRASGRLVVPSLDV